MKHSVTYHLCREFIERANYLGYKGKRRNDAALDFFVGACNAYKHSDMKDEFNAVSGFVVMILAPRGYSAITQHIAERDAEAAKIDAAVAKREAQRGLNNEPR